MTPGGGSARVNVIIGGGDFSGVNKLLTRGGVKKPSFSVNVIYTRPLRTNELVVAMSSQKV